MSPQPDVDFWPLHAQPCTHPHPHKHKHTCKSVFQCHFKGLEMAYSVGAVDLQVWEPEFKSPSPPWKLGVAMLACNSSIRGRRSRQTDSLDSQPNGSEERFKAITLTMVKEDGQHLVLVSTWEHTGTWTPTLPCSCTHTHIPHAHKCNFNLIKYSIWREFIGASACHKHGHLYESKSHRVMSMEQTRSLELCYKHSNYKDSRKNITASMVALRRLHARSGGCAEGAHFSMP